MLARIAPVLLALALSACAPLEAGSLRVDPSPDLDAEAHAAAERILAATGVAVQVGGGDADLRVPLRLVAAITLTPAEVPAACADGGCEWVGHFDGATIRISDALAVAERGGQVLHEMLHALTLSDVHLEGGVAGLLSDVAGVDCLTEADLNLVCERVACSTFAPEC